MGGEGPASGPAPGSSPPPEACGATGQAIPAPGWESLAPSPTEPWSRFPELSGLGLGKGEKACTGPWGKIRLPHTPCAPPNLPTSEEILSPQVACPARPSPLAPQQGGAAQAGHPILHLITQAEPVTSSGRDSSDNPVNHTSKQRFLREALTEMALSQPG